MTQTRKRHLSLVETAASNVGYSPGMSETERRRELTRMERHLDNKTFADVHGQRRPNYGPGSEIRAKHKPSKAALVAGAVSTVALGGYLAADHFMEKAAPNPVQVIEPGIATQDMPSPENTIIHVTQPGDTPIEIANKYSGQTNEPNLADKIYDAAKTGEDPGLDPGDRIVIPK